MGRRRALRAEAEDRPFSVERTLGPAESRVPVRLPKVRHHDVALDRGDSIGNAGRRGLDFLKLADRGRREGLAFGHDADAAAVRAGSCRPVRTKERLVRLVPKSRAEDSAPALWVELCSGETRPEACHSRQTLLTWKSREAAYGSNRTVSCSLIRLNFTGSDIKSRNSI